MAEFTDHDRQQLNETHTACVGIQAILPGLKSVIERNADDVRELEKAQARTNGEIEHQANGIRGAFSRIADLEKDRTTKLKTKAKTIIRWAPWVLGITGAIGGLAAFVRSGGFG